MKRKQIKIDIDKKIDPETKLIPTLPIFFIIIPFFIWAYIVFTSYLHSIAFNPFNLKLINWIFSTRTYYDNNTGNQNIFFEHIIHLLLLLVLIISVYGLGKKIWGLIKLEDITEGKILEQIILQIALGIAGLIYFTFAIGLAGLLYSYIIYGFIILFAIIGLYETNKLLKSLSKSEKNRLNIHFLPAVIIFISLSVVFITSLVPETFYDSLVYNIGLSQNWINHHKIFSSKFIQTSYFPHNFTVLYTVGIILKDEIIAKLIVFMFEIGILLSIFAFCKRYFLSETSWIASMIFCAVPIVLIVFCKTAIEPGLGFYEFLALFCFVNWNSSDKIKWLYLSGIFTGVTLGGKYTSFFTFTALGITVLVKSLYFDKKNFLTALRYSIIFSTISIGVASVWYLKNFIITGSPLYPLLDKFRGQMTTPDPAPIKLTFSNIIFFPWKYTMTKLQQETFLSPVYLIVLPLWFLFKRIDRNIKLIFIYFILYFLFWVTIGKGYCRFLIPVLPTLSIITAYYISYIPWDNFLKKITVYFIAFVMLVDIYYAAAIIKQSIDPLGYFLGLQSKQKYLSTERPSYPCPYYQVVEWINENTPLESKILLLGECRGYYIKRRYESQMAGDLTPLVAYCSTDSVHTGDELYEKLKKLEFTHILFNAREARRLAGYDMYHWTGESLSIFCDFWNKYVLETYHACSDITLNNGNLASNIPKLWDSFISDPRNYVFVYRILTEEESKRPHPVPYNFFLLPEYYASHRYEKLKSTIEKLTIKK